MGREIRRVPVDFVHPYGWYERMELRDLFNPGATLLWKAERKPMHEETLAQAQESWDEDYREFMADGADEIYTQEYIDECRAEYPDNKPDEWPNNIRAGEKKWSSPEEYLGERPGSDETTLYTPEGWPPEDERGWVVFETVSEGTPITPCFATAEELITWLSEKGTEWDGPMSREAAERFVLSGFSAPSLIVRNGVVSGSLESFEPGHPLAKENG